MQKSYKAYLIDLDGTLYYGTHPIPSAQRFIEKLDQLQLPYLVMTNNATQNADQVAEKLRNKYQIPVQADQVYGSSSALLDYLDQHFPETNIFLIGEPPLKKLLEDKGHQIVQAKDAQVVVQALDRQVDYQQLSQAATAIRKGAVFLVTNCDRAIPTADGFIPSSGAITAFLTFTTNKEPIVMGKPYLPILTGALNYLGLNKEDVLIVGDNLETDISLGINAGVDTLLVLTGVTSMEDLENSTIQPTYVVSTLDEWEY